MFSFVKIGKFQQGLVGFGNLRLRRSKVIPQPSDFGAPRSGDFNQPQDFHRDLVCACVSVFAIAILV